MSQLLNCPFCGFEALLFREPDADGVHHRIRCANRSCRAEQCLQSDHAEYIREAHAVSAWNTRPVPVTAEVSVNKILEQYSCDIVRIRSRLSDVKWADAGHHCESKSAVHAVIQMTKDIEQRIIPGLTAALKAQKGVGEG